MLFLFQIMSLVAKLCLPPHPPPFPDPSAMGFIISPWSLLLMPSGNISFADEYVTQQDLRAFTAPEVLEGLSLSCVSDIEKVQKRFLSYDVTEPHKLLHIFIIFSQIYRGLKKHWRKLEYCQPFA